MDWRQGVWIETERPVRRLLRQSRGNDGEPRQGHKNWVGEKGESRNILEVKASGPKRMKTE